MKKIGLIFLLALGFISAAFSQVNWDEYTPVWKQQAWLEPGSEVTPTVIKDGFSDGDALALDYASNASVNLYGSNNSSYTGANWDYGSLAGFELPEGFHFGPEAVSHFIVSGSMQIFMANSSDVPFDIVRAKTSNFNPGAGTNAATSNFFNFIFADVNQQTFAQIEATSTTSIRYWEVETDTVVVEWNDVRIKDANGNNPIQVSVQAQMTLAGDVTFAVKSSSTMDGKYGVALLAYQGSSTAAWYLINNDADLNWNSSEVLPYQFRTIGSQFAFNQTGRVIQLTSTYEDALALSMAAPSDVLPSCSAPTSITFNPELLQSTGFNENNFSSNVSGKSPYPVVNSNSCEAGFLTKGQLDSVLFVVVNSDSVSKFEFTPAEKTRYSAGQIVGTYGVVAISQMIDYWGIYRFDYFRIEGLQPQTSYTVYAYPFNGNPEKCTDGPIYGTKQEVFHFTTLPSAPMLKGIESTDNGAKINFDGFSGSVLVAYSENNLSQWSFGNPDTSVDYVAGQAFGEYAKVAYIGEVSDNQLELTFDKKANTAYSFRVWAYVENGSETLYSNGSASGKVYSPSTTIPVEFNPQPSLDPEGLYDYSMPLVGWGECEGFDVRSASYIGVLFNGQEEKVFYSSLNGDTAVLTTPWFSVDATEFEIALNLGIFASNGAVSDLAEGDSIKVSYALKPADDGDTVWVAIDTLTTMAGLSASGYNEAIKEVFFHLTDLIASTELALRVEFSAKSAVLDGGEGSEDGEAKASVPANTYIAVVSNIRIQELTKCYAPAGIMTIDGSVTDASAQVRWNAALDFEGNKAESYLVLFQKNGAGKWDTLAPVADTMATFSALDAASTYKVQVSAVCGGENGISESRSTSFSTMWNIPDSVVLPEMGWQTFGSFKQYNYVDGKFVPQTNRWSTVFHSDYSGNNDVYAYVTVGDSTSLLAMNPVYKQEGLVRFDLRVTVHNSNEFTEDIKTLFSRDFRFKVMASHKGDFSDAIEIGSISRGDLALKSFKTFSIFAGQLTDSVGAYTFGLMYYEPEPVATVPAGIEFLFESYIASYAECETITDDTATDITYNSATLSWKSDLQYFQVAYGTEGKMDTVDVTEKQTLKLTKLLPETQYSYSILGFFDEDFAFACENSKVDGAFTTVAEPVEPAVCGVPTELVSVVDTVDAKAALSWKAGENNVSYELIWKAASAANFDTVEVKDSVYTLSDLEFNTAYVWSVRGVCEENVSDFATEVEFTTVEKTVSTENAVSAAIRVFAQDGMIHVLNAAMLNIDRVDVYTTTGSMVTSQRLGSTANVSIPVKGGRVLMVAVYSAGERAVYKVFVR